VKTPTLAAAGSGSESPTIDSGRVGNEPPTRVAAAEGILPTWTRSDLGQA